MAASHLMKPQLIKSIKFLSLDIIPLTFNNAVNTFKNLFLIFPFNLTSHQGNFFFYYHLSTYGYCMNDLLFPNPCWLWLSLGEPVGWSCCTMNNYEFCQTGSGLHKCTLNIHARDLLVSLQFLKSSFRFLFSHTS